MIILTLTQVLLIIHEFLYLIILNTWLLLFKFEFVKSPNPLFAYLISMINNIIILIYMIVNEVSFSFFVMYLIYMISKIFSILTLIFDYKSKIDYFSILITILMIFIISIISTITAIEYN